MIDKPMNPELTAKAESLTEEMYKYYIQDIDKKIKLFIVGQKEYRILYHDFIEKRMRWKSDVFKQLSEPGGFKFCGIPVVGSPHHEGVHVFGEVRIG